MTYVKADIPTVADCGGDPNDTSPDPVCLLLAWISDLQSDDSLNATELVEEICAVCEMYENGTLIPLYVSVA